MEGGGGLDRRREGSVTPAILRSVDPHLAARVQEGKQVVPHSGSRGGPCTLHLLSRPLHCPGLDAILLPSGPRLGLHPLLTPSGPQLPPWSPASSGTPDPRYPPGPGPSLGCPGASQTKASMESMSPSRQTCSLGPSHPLPKWETPTASGFLLPPPHIQPC